MSRYLSKGGKELLEEVRQQENIFDQPTFILAQLEDITKYKDGGGNIRAANGMIIFTTSGIGGGAVPGFYGYYGGAWNFLG